MNQDSGFDTLDANKIIAFALVQMLEDSVSRFSSRLRDGVAVPVGDSDAHQAVIEFGGRQQWAALRGCVAVVLPAYPGLFELMRDHRDLRDKLIRIDTGAGLVIADKEIRKYLQTAVLGRPAIEAQDAATCISIVLETFLWGSHNDSFRSIGREFRADLGDDYQSLLDSRFDALEGALHSAAVDRYLGLQVPLDDYQSHRDLVFQTVADTAAAVVHMFGRYVLLRLKDVTVYNHRTRLERVLDVAGNSLGSLRVLVDTHARPHSSRIDDASVYLSQAREALRDRLDKIRRTLG